MDLFLLFFAIAALVVFLLINAKMVVYYEEEGTGITENFGSRIVVIVAFTISYSVIFLLPIDVRNSRNDGGLNMEVFWSLRMNDVHDSFADWLLPRFKRDHPDWCQATAANKKKFPTSDPR